MLFGSAANPIVLPTWTYHVLIMNVGVWRKRTKPILSSIGGHPLTDANRSIVPQSRQPDRLEGFPLESIVGSIGDLARVLAHGTEVPEEFYFASGISVLGAYCSTLLKLKVGVDMEPRFYTVLLGESYAVKKSTAMRKTLEFFGSLKSAPSLHILNGCVSAEGLARECGRSQNVLLVFDEFRSFVDKSKIQNSALLPMTASLFDNLNWDNPTKDPSQNICVRGAHLSLIGCCTTDTYSSMWTFRI